MLMHNKLYDVLKWISTIAIPAVVVFLNTVLPVWNVNTQLINQIVTTIAALGILLGSLIMVSSSKYKKEG